MAEQNELKLFEGKQIRYVWDDEREQYFFSVVDVIEVLTESPRPRKYWNALKTKLNAEGSELSQNIGQLKLPSSDGKSYLTQRSC
jgi:superoxide dismutase